MDKFVYFHNKEIVYLDTPISEELITDIDSYKDELYVPLNEDHLKFKEMCHTASIREILNLELTGVNKQRVLLLRAHEYKHVSDPIFITMQHYMYEGDIDKAEATRLQWIQAIADIKAKYPYKYEPEN